MVRKMGSSNLHRLLFTPEKSFQCCCLLHKMKTDDINRLKTKCESSTLTGSLFGKEIPKKVGICLQPKPYKVGPQPVISGGP